ncbi:MAG TPA: sensor histidine kinase [Longimicrobiales bacterium]|nr:sensor histidine kinase [Longimicrobiales bacterium]
MRLHEFIIANREAILTEWEAFARTVSEASGTMDVTALRDHASQMLSVIVADLTTYQGKQVQTEKSKGNAPEEDSPETTAAEEHGAGRAKSGFTVAQMVAEYRALRASVLRLWTKHQGELKPAEIEDLTRFNEAIDQSLAESLAEFEENVENAKEMFLAILGHDLRTPLGAIYTSARFMLDSNELEEPYLTLVSRISSSAQRSTHMVGDLLDFTRSRLGGGIPVTRAEMNLGKVLREVVEEISALHPDRKVEVDTRVEQRGQWDAGRIGQALANVIGNAVEHGAVGSTVTIDVAGDDTDVTIAIHNRGEVIDSAELDGIFNPMKFKGKEYKSSRKGPTGNLGLGLFIAERIVTAHGGRIAVESSEANGTTFTIHLPRLESS